MSITRFPSGLVVGAALMYFLDPQRGRKRRARVGEMATHAQRVERELVGKAVRDVQHRAHGLSERIKHPLPTEVTDGVVQGRVRSALGRVCSHARAIEVEAHDGCVILRGPVLEHEADVILRAAGRVPSVQAIDDRLERHASPDVPSLQGEHRPRSERAVWPPALQVGAIGAGTLAALWGLTLRRGILGTAVGAAGGALALRAAFNRPLARVLGRDAVIVQKTITVEAPIAKVFDVWSRLDNFPRFMEHVRAVIVDGKKSLWRVDGPAGTVIEYESEVTRLEPDRVIEWQTTPGQPIEHHGRVRFEEIDGGTRVQVQLSYRPPAGMLGHVLAHVLGADPKQRMDDDLARMKALIESGRTRAHGERVLIEDLH